MHLIMFGRGSNLDFYYQGKVSRMSILVILKLFVFNLALNTNVMSLVKLITPFGCYVNRKVQFRQTRSRAS